MPTFAERLKEYRVYMGFKNQEALGAVIGKDTKTVSAYEVGRIAPTLADTIVIADLLGVSLDWLTGRTNEPRWSQRIIQARLWLRSQLDKVQRGNIDQRIISIIDLMAERVPLLKEDWFAAGILGIPVATYHKFRLGQGDVNTPLLHRWADFCGLPGRWIMSGKEEHLTDPVDIGSWAVQLDRMQRMGITPEELGRNLEWLNEWITSHRDLDKE